MKQDYILLTVTPDNTPSRVYTYRLTTSIHYPTLTIHTIYTYTYINICILYIYILAEKCQAILEAVVNLRLLTTAK